MAYLLMFIIFMTEVYSFVPAFRFSGDDSDAGQFVLGYMWNPVPLCSN